MTEIRFFTSPLKTMLIASACVLALASLLSCSKDAASSATGTAAGGPGTGSGWTGLTQPNDVIAARGNLMLQMEQLMLPIDMLEVQSGGDPKVLTANAAAIAAMLQAVPHLFPPTTNLYDPKSETPVTIALPAIWQNFDSFYALARATAKAADTMAATQGDAELKSAGAALRSACTACHTLFLRKYEEPKVNKADADFDFDKALGK